MTPIKHRHRSSPSKLSKQPDDESDVYPKLRRSKTHVSIGQALTMAALAAAFAAVVTALIAVSCFSRSLPNIYSYQPVAARGVISQVPYPTSPSTSWKVGMSKLDQDQAETGVATSRVELEHQDASPEVDALVISEGTIEDDPHIKAQSLGMENVTTTDTTTHPLARQNQTTITTSVTTTDMTTHPLARQNQTTSLPTSVPMNPPTAVPTNPPMAVPTNPPTQAPSDPPANQPTFLPTKVPTNALKNPPNPPTAVPTNPPTQAPTNPPTCAPSDPPTNQPTFLPTNTPTNALKNPPTVSPTSQPTNAPTLPPTTPPTSTMLRPKPPAFVFAPTLPPATPPTITMLRPKPPAFVFVFWRSGICSQVLNFFAHAIYLQDTENRTMVADTSTYGNRYNKTVGLLTG
jgi:hypothetical protein